MTQGIMNQQQLNQQGKALLKYCKIMRSNKFGTIAIVVTVLMGVLITLLVAAVEPLLKAVFVGGLISGLFGLLCRFVCKNKTGSVQRLNAYLAADGEQGVYSDFAFAQPFENDQFRLGRQYLYIKTIAVVRLSSIYDIVRLNLDA